MIDVLTNVSIASFANCVYRNLKDENLASRIAKQFLRMFNSPEAASVIDLCIRDGEKEDKSYSDYWKYKETGKSYKVNYSEYWKQVLAYCYSGNLQAVLDEYFYMVVESNSLKNVEKEEQNKKIEKVFTDAISINTTTYNIDTIANFKKRIENKVQKLKQEGNNIQDENRVQEGNNIQDNNIIQEDNNIQGNNTIQEENNIQSNNTQENNIQESNMQEDKYARTTMRASFAMGFASGDTEDENQVNSRENMQNAFNSPFRPFVLTTTSIGQEGLDFHYYCRRIIHWNLPTNPVDMEQRDGRINRFKNLAIRKYIVENNKREKFEENIWDEMFEDVEKNVVDKQGGMVPFWCLPNNQKPEIERIIPLYAFSQDEIKYEDIKKVLELYRITLGQEHQEEIIKKLCEDKKITKGEMERLSMRLSPMQYVAEEKGNN